MAKRFLAFDLGTQNGCAILGILDHGKLTLEERPRFSNPGGEMNSHRR